MFETTFYRFVPVTKEELDEVYDREGIAFVIKEDSTEEVKKIINKIASLTPYKDHMATYIIITGDILNKYYSEYWEYKRLYPDDITFLAFYLDEMEDRNPVLGEFGLNEFFWVDDLIEGFAMEQKIEVWEKIK